MFRRENAIEAIERQGRKRRWVAEQCGITYQYLSRVLSEKEACPPSKGLAYLMSRVLDISPDELWVDENPSKEQLTA